jgi:predicted nuclease with TOPRIM domain
MDERFREVFGHFDAIYGRLERLEQEYVMVTQALRRIEGLLADEAGRHDVLEHSVAELKRHVATLRERIDDLEQRMARSS